MGRWVLSLRVTSSMKHPIEHLQLVAVTCRQVCSYTHTHTDVLGEEGAVCFRE